MTCRLQSKIKQLRCYTIPKKMNVLSKTQRSCKKKNIYSMDIQFCHMLYLITCQRLWSERESHHLQINIHPWKNACFIYRWSTYFPWIWAPWKFLNLSSEKILLSLPTICTGIALEYSCTLFFPRSHSAVLNTPCALETCPLRWGEGGLSPTSLKDVS